MHGNLRAALGVLEAEAESVPQQQEHAVMNWCRDKGWLKPEDRQWKLLAMIQRGLVVHDSVDCLTCLHHNKQLHGFECVRHFTVVNNFHQNEAPSLHHLAENIEINVQNEQADEATGGSAVLTRYFGLL